MDKFIHNIYITYGLDVTKSMTISKLAFNIYMSKYYNDNIPLISNNNLWNSIKNAYYGGIAEVYKPYGENLYYYDVNSLYPYAALNDMPGLECYYKEYIINKPDIEGLFGFYYCKVSTTDNYIGLLPVRTEDGSVIMPNGS